MIKVINKAFARKRDNLTKKQGAPKIKNMWNILLLI